MPIPEKATDTALYAFVRVKSQPPFEMDVETNRGNRVDHRGKRKGVGLTKGLDSTKEMLTRVASVS